MPRGGSRPGAGAKYTWIHGKTKTIRVPESLADEILRVARIMDEGGKIDDVTRSKYVNLSDVSVRSVSGRPAVFLDDMVNAGYKIRPFELLSRVRKFMDRIR
jgi:hypothetical protein